MTEAQKIASNIILVVFPLKTPAFGSKGGCRPFLLFAWFAQVQAELVVYYQAIAPLGANGSTFLGFTSARVAPGFWQSIRPTRNKFEHMLRFFFLWALVIVGTVADPVS